MPRSALVLACLAACGPGHVATPPSLDLARLTSIAATPPRLPPGEQMTWKVYWRSVEIGRADLSIGAGEARSTFRTSMLASALVSVRYALVTAFDRTGARTATETLSRGGTADRSVETAFEGASYTVGTGDRKLAPGGHHLHTLHTALGVVRTWSSGEARHGFLWLAQDGELYRLDVFPPVREQALGVKALRIDGVVRAFDQSSTIEVTMWLAANEDRTPVQVAVRTRGEYFSAELVESTASFGTP